MRAACPANGHFNLLLFGGLFREHVVTFVTLAMVPLHGASVWGTCWGRPAAGSTGVAPV
jgi:hypothetical protein